MTTVVLESFVRIRVNGVSSAKFKRLPYAVYWAKTGHQLSDAKRGVGIQEKSTAREQAMNDGVEYLFETEDKKYEGKFKSNLF